MKKRILSLLVCLVLFAVPLMCYAASYNSTFDFYVRVQGSTRSYSAGTIHISTNSNETTYGYNPASSQFKIELFRKNFIGATYIGSGYADRVGADLNQWTNMDAGDYYFEFTKANDGTRVHGDCSMYN